MPRLPAVRGGRRVHAGRPGLRGHRAHRPPRHGVPGLLPQRRLLDPALNAAAVVASTAGPDALQQFHDLLYAHQPDEQTGSGLTDDQLISYAEQAGASGDAVESGIRDQRYGGWVERATDQASKDGVTGTPTVFVDGTELDDVSADGLSAAVAAATS